VAYSLYNQGGPDASYFDYSNGNAPAQANYDAHPSITIMTGTGSLRYKPTVTK